MHVPSDVLHQLVSEVIGILVDTGAVKKALVENGVDQALSDEVAPINAKYFYKRQWSWDIEDDEDGMSDMESRIKGRNQLVKWLRFDKDLDSGTMERLVAIGVAGNLVWWNALMLEVLERLPSTKILGSGAYGTVLGLAGRDHVLKVSVCADDDAWHTYARKVMDTEGNPFLPRIDGVWFWNNVMVAKIEHLATDDLFKEDGGTMFRELVYSSRPTSEVVESLYIGDRMEREEKIHCWLEEVARIVFETRDETGGGLDIHNGNLLFRGTIPVLTDPISGGNCQYAHGMRDKHQALKEKLYAQAA